MSDVFLLGAGFSKAVSNSMPLLGELSSAIRKQIDLPEALLTLGENVELWMTYLSQPQPWLSESENLRNKALFLDMSRQLGSILHDCTQVVVLDAAVPEWLNTLVHWWHENKCNIITLNYDTLVERAAGLIEPRKGYPLNADQIYPVPLPDIRRSMVFASEQVESLKLVKLHGSVNWHYSGATTYFGETIYSSYVRPWGIGGDEEDARARATEERSRVAGSDKVPLIVPPTTEKVGYFQHETVRRLWYLAGEALRLTGRLVCIGYSLPITDLSIQFFLADNHASEKIPLIIVNKDPGAEARYKELVGSSYEVEQPFSGPDAVQQFVKTLD